MKKIFWFFFLALFVSGAGAEPAPDRIVSIAPSFTEILYALGLGNQIVGTTNYCDYPEAAKQTEKVGDMLNPNLEKILSLHPNLVFCGSWKWHVPEKLRELKIRVVEITDAQTVDDVYKRILLIGKETSTENEARRIVEHMKQEAQQIANHSTREPRPKIYLELDSGQWTVGGGSYMNEILEIIGARNIFAERKDAPALPAQVEHHIHVPIPFSRDFVCLGYLE